MKTVLILSESSDQSTSDVMDWIEFFGGKSNRVNKSTDVKLVGVEIMNNSLPNYNLEIDGESLDSENVYSYWYRRGYLKLSNSSPDFSKFDKHIRNHTEHNINKEFEVLEELIHEINESKRSIGSQFKNTNINKLVVLRYALAIGLKIPNSRVFSNKKQLNSVFSFIDTSITKAISESLSIPNSYNDKHEFIVTYTEDVVNENIPTSFFPSLIQEKIIKQFELRIFYLKRKFYSMAIFSQNDKQTDTDFRKYNKVKPNRTTPFKLPEEISKKLLLLMRKLSLDSGSIDMIVTKSNEYIFLEVNPVGQFGMVSYPCNYKIEKKIAHFLTK